MPTPERKTAAGTGMGAAGLLAALSPNFALGQRVLPNDTTPRHDEAAQGLTAASEDRA